MKNEPIGNHGEVEKGIQMRAIRILVLGTTFGCFGLETSLPAVQFFAVDVYDVSKTCASVVRNILQECRVDVELCDSICDGDSPGDYLIQVNQICEYLRDVDAAERLIGEFGCEEACPPGSCPEEYPYCLDGVCAAIACFTDAITVVSLDPETAEAAKKRNNARCRDWCTYLEVQVPADQCRSDAGA